MGAFSEVFLVLHICIRHECRMTRDMDANEQSSYVQDRRLTWFS